MISVQHPAAYWTSTNPVLGLDMEGVETDTKKIKYGDAASAWNDLPYSGLKRISRHVEVEVSGFQELSLVSGVIDGVNDTFVWSGNPLQVYYNGQLLREGVGYVQTGTTTVFTNPPFVGEDIWSFGGNGTLEDNALTAGAIDGVNDAFTWDKAPIQLFWNGQLLREGVGYTIAGNITTLTTPPDIGDSLWSYANY